MEKHNALNAIIVIAFPLFYPSRHTTQGLTVPIHGPNGPLTQGPNHVHIVLRRRGGEMFTGLFHSMQPLQPALTHH